LTTGVTLWTGNRPTCLKDVLNIVYQPTGKMYYLLLK